ncbi:MAG TPA: ATP-binding protein [Polyangia bacterium]
MAEASDLARTDVVMEEGNRSASPTRAAPRGEQGERWIYLVAVAAPVATLLLRLLADPWMQARPALVWFLVPIILIAYRGGLGPGLLATGVSAVATKYFLARPAHTFGFLHVVDFIQWTIFVANGVMISSLSERLRRARRRAESMLDHLSRTQVTLHEGEERLRIANEVAGIGTYDADLATGRVRFSPEMHAILGAPSSLTSIGEAFEVVLPEDRERLGQLLAQADDPANPGTVRAELRILRPDGEIRWLAWSGRTFFQRGPEGARPIRRVGACVDVTELRRAERRLATQHAVSRVLADASTLRAATPLIMQAVCDSEGWDFGAIWQLDAAGARLLCSETWCRPGLELERFRRETEALSFAFGEGLPGRVWQAGAALLWRDLATESSYARASAALAVGLRSALGFPILMGGRVTGVIDFLGRRIPSADPKMLETFDTIGRQLGTFFERKAAEAERQDLEVQLRQAQKMEAIGQLSGGIAHDFNNILTAISANLHLAADDVGPDHAAAPSLADAARATDRATDLVRQILLFARRRPIERRAIDPKAVVEQSVRLLRATLPAGVEVRLSAAAGVPAVSADATQLQQVIMNLGTNAWHALAQGNGHVDLSIEGVELDADAARAIVGGRPGRWVRFAVRDDGVGMDAATLERIFEPFFTTKGPDRGTGLGLSVVHGIVTSHDGFIAVRSSPGAGSTFEVYLPAAERPGPAPAPEAVEAAHGAGEHVLFIDDEPMLNRSASRGLERSGYRVSAHSDPRRALEDLRRRPGDFALVITDMNMPNLSGLEVARAVRQLRPDLPILLLSGNIGEEVRAAAAEIGIDHVIQKPWTLEDLADAVKRQLDARAMSPGRSTRA